MTRLIDRLTVLHRAIDAAVVRERARRLPDAVRLAALKKRRLAVKDRIALALARRAIATA